MMLPRTLFICLIASLSACHAAVIEQVTLKDGRQIAINDDYSWNVILTETNTAAPEAVAADAITSSRKANLSAQALANPALLHDTVSQGVRVQLIPHPDQAASGQIELSVSNLQETSVVQIMGRISFYDQQGVWLADQETRFWQAEYRLPETYLRKQQIRPFTTEPLSIPKDAVINMTRLTILKVERR